MPPASESIMTLRVMLARVKTTHFEKLSYFSIHGSSNKECSPGVNWTRMIPTKPKEALVL